jgi:hypothetical protein
MMNNTAIDLREIGLESAEWIHLAERLAVVNTVMNLRVP